MKSTEKVYILQFLYQQTKAVFEGVIEDHIRAKHNYKASNVARVCRQLREDGYLQKIPAPHPDNGRPVNTYILTEAGRQYFLNQIPQGTKDFLEEFGNKPAPLIQTPQTALF